MFLPCKIIAKIFEIFKMMHIIIQADASSFICKKFVTIENSVWIFLLHQISSANFNIPFYILNSGFPMF